MLKRKNYFTLNVQTFADIISQIRESVSRESLCPRKFVRLKFPLRLKELNSDF